MRCILIAALPLVLLFSTVPVQAKTWYVLPNGTGDAPTIQAGIDSATNGDKIELADGTYTGDGNWDIQFNGKAVEVLSGSGNPEDCVIDIGSSTGPSHRGFLFINGEGAGSVLNGVKVKDGWGFRGGGVQVVSASPTLRNCIFELNRAITGGAFSFEGASPTVESCYFINNLASGSAGGAGFTQNFSAPTMSDCHFEGNVATSYGGALYMLQSTPNMTDCRFVNNSANQAGGIFLESSSNAQFTRCSFVDNTAISSIGGVRCAYSDPLFDNCLIARNSAPQHGGFSANNSSAPTFRNCTITNNVAAEVSSGITLAFSSVPAVIENCIIANNSGGPAVVCQSSVVPLITCTDISGNSGGNWVGCIADLDTLNSNFSADPLFCDADGADFTLHSDSPCADGNHPGGAACGLIGALDVDCGPTTAVEHTSWGEVKSMFR